MKKVIRMALCACVLGLGAISAADMVYPSLNEESADAPVGARPYEMDWA